MSAAVTRPKLSNVSMLLSEMEMKIPTACSRWLRIS
jgi:hypothetical protein